MLAWLHDSEMGASQIDMPALSKAQGVKVAGYCSVDSVSLSQKLLTNVPFYSKEVKWIRQTEKDCKECIELMFIRKCSTWKRQALCSSSCLILHLRFVWICLSHNSSNLYLYSTSFWVQNVQLLTYQSYEGRNNVLMNLWNRNAPFFSLKLSI